MSPKHLFAAFDVTKQVFYTTPLSIGIVNLKPLLPGHVLILPRRVVPRLADLYSSEISDLFLTVQRIGKGLEELYNAQALTVSLQDGKSAGQSVPHVHVHILPRHSTDFEGENDRIYPLLEQNESTLRDDLTQSEIPIIIKPNGNEDSRKGVADKWETPKDEDRKPRSMEEMVIEAKRFEEYFKKIE
ncbi:uncharacterized protein IL334_002444 [Kwoniella shivajii]|uniref:Bis(5'-adenosyl)-triphosphatase n=1 Tax=Kwoniella shivajii TaxID=564305 RepID=A0ABZ1CUR3_9TREE|nr:hypothetical protein IL334_002444 [Kwoniella shivajii]